MAARNQDMPGEIKRKIIRGELTEIVLPKRAPKRGMKWDYDPTTDEFTEVKK